MESRHQRMKSLTGLQEEFHRHVIKGDRAVIDEVAGPDEAYRLTRLAIYYNAYRLRLIDALATDYPAMQAFLGETGFRDLALAYIEACPSTVRNLRWFGAGIPGFLHDDPNYRDRPALAELAAFEWAQGLAFDADDAPLTSFEQIASVAPADWPGLRFIAHPSLHLVESNWNVLAIWHAHRDEQPMPELARHEHADTIAVWRRDFKTYFRTLEDDETWLWRTFANGTGFGEACASFTAVTGGEDANAAQRAAGLLRSWVDEGWIRDYAVSTDD